MGHRPCPLVCLGWTSSPSFVSSVRSSSVYPGLLPTYIHTYPATFFRFFRFGAMLPIYIIHSLITFTLIQCSIYRTEPGNTFAWITLKTHTCTNFFKILQGSLDFSKTQHVLYFLNAWSSKISNMTYANILHTYLAHLAHILHTYWAHIAHILHTSCAHLAHTLHILQIHKYKLFEIYLCYGY